MIDADAIEQLLPLEDVKKHLSVEADDEDELIQQIVYAAIEVIEDETGHRIGVRAVSEQFRGFEAIRLRAWPLLSVTSIDYFDASGEPATLDASLVRLSAAKRPGRLVLKSGMWPASSAAADAVGVTVQAGYEPDDVPHRLRQAALIMIADLYGQRESWTPGSATKVPVSLTVERLLAKFTLDAL
jgi:uncharacterized phiE125 gp8 family phage protein